MYDFRITDMPDGNQVIDRNLKTSYNTLTPIQILEYDEMDTQLYIMDRMERRGVKRSARRRKFLRNVLRDIACQCGLA